ncbi:NAD(P)H-dependent oxidoreductase [Neisseria chenwenguii]|uniref:NAD(P)H-dependent oxidoreductase n=1 Tax=Neisseria chenwenguii TaxID=1853278 RepID=UPI0018DF4DD0|nr:NAD(P)H-dependent oxidoreductase [Neisseria chenwenguii]
MPKNILIVSGHPDLQHGPFANKAVMDTLEAQLPEAAGNYLDRAAPDFKFDVPAEQEKLMVADVIVLQFPLFWYGVPALMKKWIEDVFVHGFSHSSTVDKVA